jgi:DNA-binding NarL/FixJ family response regulator
VVVVTAGHGGARELRRLFAAGADGVVLDSALEGALVPTIQAVCEGQVVAPRELWRAVERPLLSRREKQIMAMVILGLTNREIAQQLFVTEATVKSHLSATFAKLGVRSRTQATARILDPEHGLGTGILAITNDGVD